MEEKNSGKKTGEIDLNLKINLKKACLFAGLLVFLIVLGVIFYKMNDRASGFSGLSVGDIVELSYSVELESGEMILEGTKEAVLGSVGTALGLSDKIDEKIMNIDGEKEIEIMLSAEEAFGEYDEAKVVAINRTEKTERRGETNRTFMQTKEEFEEAFGEEPEAGKTYGLQNAFFDYKVISVDGEDVKISQEVEVGQIIPVNELLFIEIAEVTDEKIVTMLNAENQTIEVPAGNLTIAAEADYITFTLTPPLGERIVVGMNPSPAKVVSYDEKEIVLDYNPDYAGEKVIVKAQVLDVQEGKSSSSADVDGPTLESFVMTHCPFGTQMEKGILPVYKLLKDKANFKIRFVSYTMHGDIEEEETKRQVCIREETDFFWEYLECFLEDGDAARCIEETGLDESEINECIESRADSYWEVDKRLNEVYGVTGSPTNVLDGEVVQIYPRDPESVKQTICDLLNAAECSQTLSTDNPSSGFGFGTSSSGSGGSCG